VEAGWDRIAKLSASANSLSKAKEAAEEKRIRTEYLNFGLKQGESDN